jgi:hypothetical protein
LSVFRTILFDRSVGDLAPQRKGNQGKQARQAPAIGRSIVFEDSQKWMEAEVNACGKQQSRADKKSVLAFRPSLARSGQFAATAALAATEYRVA